MNAALKGPAACLSRCYRVEQEASMVAAIDRLLLASARVGSGRCLRRHIELRQERQVAAYRDLRT
jgi:hypothetical protein